jgi:excisionase family DNA binding protein
MEIPSDRVLLATDVARILRTSRQRVYKLVASGELIGRRFGNRWIFDPAEVEQLVRRGPRKEAA